MFSVYRFHVNHHLDIATSSDPTDITQKSVLFVNSFFLSFLFFFF